MLKHRIVKTVVPYVVGFVTAMLATHNVVLPPEQLDGLQNALTLGVGTVYYVVAILLAKKWPKMEWLLGSPNKPTYRK